MKFISLFTRLGLLALGFILVAVVNDDSVWANASTSEPTTAGLADSLLNEWGLALLVLRAVARRLRARVSLRGRGLARRGGERPTVAVAHVEQRRAGTGEGGEMGLRRCHSRR